MAERLPADPALARGRLSRFPHTLAAGIVVFVLQFVHGPATGFVYDMVQYWGAPLALLSGGDVEQVGVLQIRGALSAVVYLPPATLTTLLGDSTAVWTVLAWNALLAAVLCVLLLPRIAALIAPGRSHLRIWVSALVGGVILSGYARYPLLDVWSTAFALAGVYALASSRRWWTALLGGVAIAAAINLRPSYLAPLLIAALVLAVARPRAVAWAVPGLVLGTLPQFVFNIAALGQASVVPIATPFLMNVQAAQATYAIRYDTIPFTDGHPQQWYCDPGYAALVVGDPAPTGPLGVLASAAQHLPQSLGFLSQKAAASLHWSFATPYEHPPGDGTSLMTLLIVAVSSLGLIGLVWRVATSWRDRDARMVTFAILGFWCGALATLVLSTPETRFALPLVMVGLIGLLVVTPTQRIARPRRGAVVAVGIAVALAVGLFAVGKAGLAHPMPAGPLADASACAALDEERAP